MSRYLMAMLVIGCLLPNDLIGAKKNVVLYVTDDQGQDAGCYGNRVIQTPNMDKLAADGTLFNFAFCTTASCSASRSVILTGLFNHANGQYGHQHSYNKFSSFPNIKSLPVLMSKGGYRTIRCGKYHVAPEEVYKFDTAVKGSSRSPVEMANNCQPVIAADDDRPFFLYICTSDPHRGGGFANDLPYKPDRFGNKPGDGSYPGISEVKYDPKDVIVPPYLPDTPTCRAELAQYYQSVSRIDQGLGRLMQVLTDAGVYDDTLIIYISDHGIAFPGAKTTVYEPGLRSPCIVRNPYAKQRGVKCNGMVSWIDLAPTILDFAGILDKKTGTVPAKIAGPSSRRGRAQPYGFHGRSFLSILQEENPQGWDEIHASHTFHEITMYYPMRVVRNRRYKLIWNIAHPLPYPFASDLWRAPTFQDVYQQGMHKFYGKRTVQDYIQRPQFELYDLEKDPHETKRLAGDPKYATVLEELKQNLVAFQKRTKDPWILKWRYE